MTDQSKDAVDPSVHIPIDWANEPELVQTNDSSLMQSNVSRGTQEQIDAEKRKESKTGFIDTIGKALTYGDNSAVQIVYDLQRIDGAGPVDPAWKTQGHKAWLDQRSGEIDVMTQWRYTQTRNQLEAEEMLADQRENARQQELLNLRSGDSPISTFAARGLASMVDWDAPLSVVSGGIAAGAKLGINATKMGRMLSGAATGSGFNAALAASAYYSDPNADWTSIPVAGLMGLGFGLVGGAIAPSRHAAENVSQAANAGLNKTVDEFDNTLKEGVPQAAKDVRDEIYVNDDPYQSAAVRAQEIDTKELAAAAKTSEGNKPSTFSVDDIEREEVADIDGPTLYHGTTEKFDTFDIKHAGKNSGETNSRNGFFFTTNKDVAETYASKPGKLYGRKQGTVKEMKARLKNPLIVDYKGASYTQVAGNMDLLTEQFVHAKYGYEQYDGIIFKNLDDAAGKKGQTGAGAPKTDAERIISDVYFIRDTSLLRNAADEVDAAKFGLDGSVSGSSVGAKQMGQTGPGVASIKSERISDTIQANKSRDAKEGISAEWNDLNNQLRNRSDNLARGVQRFQDVVDAVPILGSDYARFMKSGSAVATMFAYDFLESASGKIRQNRTASALMEVYRNNIMGEFLPYHDAYDQFSSLRGQGLFQKTFSSDLRKEFDHRVILELQRRRYDAPNPLMDAQVPTYITKAADAIDNAFKKEIEVGKGRPGEGSWNGFDQLVERRGYFPQKWVGGKMLKLTKKFGGKLQENLVIAVKEAYLHMHPSMSKQDAETWASAMVDRALRQEDGLTTNLVSVLQSDGRGMLEDMLRRQPNMNEQKIKKLIDSLTGNMEKASKPGQTKQRIDVDMRFTASNGISMMDLIDSDINSIVAARARRTAGQGAMARKGILSRQDFEHLKESIIAEQKANGENVPSGTSVRDKANDYVDSDKHLTAEFLDDVYSYFGSGPVAGGVSPTYSRIRKLTNLSLLNQLGLTQLAEFGPQIAAVGWKRFAEHAGDAFMSRLHNKDSEIAKELQHLGIMIPEERMYRDDLVFEYEKANPQAGELMQRFDNMLNKGQRVQGFLSGFYEVRKIQQRIAVTSANDRIMRTLAGTDSMSVDRLRDIGFDKDLINRVQQYVHGNIVEFDPKSGSVKRLNLSKWDPLDAEDYALALNRNTNQMVQKAMIGESNVLFHKDGAASLFFHLKSFPLLAMEKQFARNVNMADQQALTTFFYGLGTAGAAYTIKQALNLNSDNLTASRIATGAFGLSNMSGWIPMWTDPLAGLLGLDKLQMGGGKYGTNSVISLPASLSTMDRLVQAPASAVKFLNPFATMSNSDIRNLQTIPIFGNLIGVNAFFNSLKT